MGHLADVVDDRRCDVSDGLLKMGASAVVEVSEVSPIVMVIAG
jgi:hypothetical protein